MEKVALSLSNSEQISEWLFELEYEREIVLQTWQCFLTLTLVLYQMF